tara:strand:- start:55 stop:813 length:759 start_codon:yes stop_codon:yes gene_type:complete
MSILALQSDLLSGVQHGFMARPGGHSRGLYEGLNCGVGSHDDPAAVAQNRALVAAHFGVPPEALMSLHQVHSTTVVRVARPGWDGPRPRADALVTAHPGIAICALAADCAPLLFADRRAGVVGAAHAGWRGALDGVALATIAAMEDLGARRGDIAVAIGPTISQRAYEVGPDYMDNFLADDPAHARFFAQGQGDRLMFDLPGFLLAQLRTAGVQAAWIGHCTHSDEARFYSYRRATQRGEPDYGRQIAVIRL